MHYFPPYTQVYFYLLSPRSGHRFYRHTTRSPRNGPGAQSDHERCPLKKNQPKTPTIKIRLADFSDTYVVPINIQITV